MINIRNKTYRMLLSIIENVNEEIPLVIKKILEIKSCVRGFHFFRNSWQHKFWMPGIKTNCLLLNIIGIQLRIKVNTEKLLDMFLNTCRSKCIYALNMAIFKRLAARRVWNTMHVFCIFWAPKNVTKIWKICWRCLVKEMKTELEHDL